MASSSAWTMVYFNIFTLFMKKLNNSLHPSISFGSYFLHFNFLSLFPPKYSIILFKSQKHYFIPLYLLHILSFKSIESRPLSILLKKGKYVGRLKACECEKWWRSLMLILLLWVMKAPKAQSMIIKIKANWIALIWLLLVDNRLA